jgi:hypothetical protein
MTVLKALELVKNELKEGYEAEYRQWETYKLTGEYPEDEDPPDDYDPTLTLAVDGSYDEDSDIYAFEVFYMSNGKRSGSGAFAFWVDKKTGEITSSDAPGIPHSSFKKKLNIGLWTPIPE